MNKKRRDKLREVEGGLSKCLTLLESICEEEQEYMDNIPENLQSSERYSSAEECVDHINESIDSVNDAIDGITQAIHC